MKSPSNVWIVTSGRAGSTAMTGIIRKMGGDVDKNNVGNVHSEHPILVDINDQLIKRMYGEIGEDHHNPESWFVVPPPNGWQKWMKETDLRDFALKVQDKEAMLPPVLKDPRWSITLGFWHRFAVTVPQHILYLDRDPEQAASSWALVHPEFIDMGTESVSQKRTYLEEWLDKYEYRGTEVHRLNYPDFFYEDEGQASLAKLLADIFHTEEERAIKAINFIVDKSRIHKYNLKDETGDAITSYGPESGYDYIAVEREGAGLTKEAEEMLNIIGQARCPGIRPMVYGIPNTEFESEIVKE